MTQPINRIRAILQRRDTLRARVAANEASPGPDLYNAKEAVRQFHTSFQSELTWLVAEVLVDQDVKAL